MLHKLLRVFLAIASVTLIAGSVYLMLTTSNLADVVLIVGGLFGATLGIAKVCEEWSS